MWCMLIAGSCMFINCRHGMGCVTLPLSNVNCTIATYRTVWKSVFDLSHYRWSLWNCFCAGPRLCLPNPCWLGRSKLSVCDWGQSQTIAVCDCGQSQTTHTQAGDCGDHSTHEMKVCVNETGISEITDFLWPLPDSRFVDEISHLLPITCLAMTDLHFPICCKPLCFPF